MMPRGPVTMAMIAWIRAVNSWFQPAAPARAADSAALSGADRCRKSLLALHFWPKSRKMRSLLRCPSAGQAGLTFICKVLNSMVTIRLSRGGAKKRPFYHLVATDSRSPRDGRYIERLGFYNPLATSTEEVLRVDAERMKHWLSKGAQASERVQYLIKEHKVAI